jgi:amidase
MSGFSDYHEHDAVGLAGLIRSGEISAEEVRAEAVRRAKTHNPELNAIVRPLYERASKPPDEMFPPGPFPGVPFLLKDLQHALAGVPMSSGSRAMRDFVPSRDCEMVRRWKAAGLVPLGKTNTPELGLMGVTEPELFGPARNPWNTTRSPGGSSGGSAAAVAARIVPVASGGDGGGSIRIPASCCGLFGLKPSRGRTPSGPDFGAVWEGAVADHVLSLSVRDSAALLDATHGPDPGPPYLISEPETSFLKASREDPPPLRIGFCAESPLGAGVDADNREAVKRAADLLADLGHRVEEVALPYSGELVAECYVRMYFAQTAAALDLMGKWRGKRVMGRELELSTRAVASQGRIMNARDYCLSLQRWNEIARAMGRFHQQYDLLLTPVLAGPVPRIGEMGLSGWERFGLSALLSTGLSRLLSWSGAVKRSALASLARVPFTQVANITGQPAMSLPLHRSADGMPCGVQFISALGGETTLFRLAGQLERAKSWFHDFPPLIRNTAGS